MEIRLSEKVLIKLEDELNQISLLEMPLGGVMANFFIVDFLYGNRNWSRKKYFIDLISSLSLRYRTNRGVFSQRAGEIVPPNFGENKALLTFISSRPYLFNINFELWNLLGEDESISLIFKSDLRSKFSSKTPGAVIELANFQAPDFQGWAKAYSAVAKDIRRVLKKFRRQNNLSRMVTRRIQNKLMEQSQSLYFYYGALAYLKPRYIVVESDRYSLTSPLVVAANSLNIPTYTMMHGAVNYGFAYLPLLADKLLCWGRQQKQMLVKFGADEERIAITGAPQSSNLIKGSKAEIKEKLSLKSNQRVIVLATNPMSPEQRAGLLNIFCSVIEGNESWKGVVRLHPSEPIELYSSLIGKYKDILFDKNQILEFDETLAVADLVCVYNSAFGLDALFKGVPVSVINVDEEFLGQGSDLINVGLLNESKSAEELKEFINKWANSLDFKTSYQKKCDFYASDYCAYFGREAAERSLQFFNSQFA
ncbi:MAG: hypothetical protein CMI29_06315 [Opitutae bacterium]|nr:hypothetical protein [Opitutae bacterium]|tara:strand:+ start:31266 stop:32702 length:1437 start_codon:yes stop_codon:yes gene_type:complete